jgi:hypothetical protein
MPFFRNSLTYLPQQGTLFYGYLESGNYQIHPETGEQCPASPELAPELFQKSKGKGKNK